MWEAALAEKRLITTATIQIMSELEPSRKMTALTSPFAGVAEICL
jgi:hypothetical protein